MCLGMPRGRDSQNAGARTVVHTCMCTHAHAHTHIHTSRTHTPRTHSNYRQECWACVHNKAYADTRQPCTLMTLTSTSHTRVILSFSPPSLMISCPDPHVLKRVWQLYDMLLDPVTWPTGMWDGQSQCSILQLYIP